MAEFNRGDLVWFDPGEYDNTKDIIDNNGDVQVLVMFCQEKFWSFINRLRYVMTIV